jgi:uncharacterized protein (DUF427 family)
MPVTDSLGAEEIMGLSWQQGPLSTRAIGRFLVPEPLPKTLLYAERLRRRMRVLFDGIWIADSENVVLFFEPGHHPMAYFPKSDISASALERTEYTTQHDELGSTSWYVVRAGEKTAPHGAWEHTNLPNYASFADGWLSHGRPWAPFTKKMNESWVTPPTVIIASTSAKPPAPGGAS